MFYHMGSNPTVYSTMQNPPSKQVNEGDRHRHNPKHQLLAGLSDLGWALTLCLGYINSFQCITTSDSGLRCYCFINMEIGTG